MQSFHNAFVTLVLERLYNPFRSKNLVQFISRNKFQLQNDLKDDIINDLKDKLQELKIKSKMEKMYVMKETKNKSAQVTKKNQLDVQQYIDQFQVRDPKSYTQID